MVSISFSVFLQDILTVGPDWESKNRSQQVKMSFFFSLFSGEGEGR
jgi:hypothetical protein